jgi:hypothetical protein
MRVTTMSNYAYLENQNNRTCQSLTHYIHALFERYARLLVIRIDLNYHKPESVLLTV